MLETENKTMNDSLQAVREELVQRAGRRRAEVQTMAGWTPVEQWNPYGIADRDGRSYVTFFYDPARLRVLERPNTEMARLVPADMSITGSWPVRFVGQVPEV
jgi:hypothetical protein